jgi:hypothetical protein
MPSILQRIARWLLGKSAPPALEGPQWFGPFSIDAYRRQRPPTAAELLSELKNTAWTCASINAAACASFPPKLYVSTGAGQAPPRARTRRLDSETNSRLRDAPHLSLHTQKALLLVESLDRLSREEVDNGWELFRDILKSGVEIVTREPERHYRTSDLKELGTRIEVQVYFHRAYNESATKSMRGKDYWKHLRAKGKPVRTANGNLRKTLPAWLQLSDDGQRIIPIPDAARAIRLIYKWGEGLGLDRITERLNRKGLGMKAIGRNPEWCRSYVAKILQDKAVVGEYQPHTIQDGKRVPIGTRSLTTFPPSSRRMNGTRCERPSMADTSLEQREEARKSQSSRICSPA